MLKKYKNEILQILIDKGYNPLDFTVEEGEENYPSEGLQTETRFFQVGYKQSYLKFKIWESPHSFHSFSYQYKTFSKRPSTQSIQRLVDFNMIKDTFTNWIVKHVQEFAYEENTPDLWFQIHNYHNITNSHILLSQDTEPFSKFQQQHIQDGLTEFQKQIVAHFSPTQEQLQHIEQRLTYLGEAATRLNRFDWYGVLISTFIGIMLNLSLDTEKGQILYELLQQAFQSVQNLLAQ